MGYFLGKGTVIKSNYGLSSNVSVFCRCYGYSIVTVLDALDHDPNCGFATNGFQPMLRWFRFVGFLPLLTVTCRCTGFSLATGICRFLRILVALLRVLLRQSGWLHYYGHLPLQWSFLAANSLPCFRIFQSKASAVVTEFPTSRGSVAANDSVFFRIIRCCQGYRWYIHGLFVSFELRLNSNDTVQWICPLMLDWAPIVKINLNQKSEPGITCSFDCPLWNQTCIFSIKYELRISRLPFHGTRASE